jgi:hypothetical protein
MEPVVGAKADSLAAACPGLFSVEGSGPSRRAVAGDARQHEKQLEKVCARYSHMNLFTLAFLLDLFPQNRSYHKTSLWLIASM